MGGGPLQAERIQTPPAGRQRAAEVLEQVYGGDQDETFMEERRKLSFQLPADTVAAIGKGKNRCYVIPSLEMVVIPMGGSEGREFRDNKFLIRLLGTK